MAVSIILPPLHTCSQHISLPLVSGNSGLGKSTLVNTLFKSQVSRRSAGWARDEKIPKTIEVKAVSHGKYREKPTSPL